MINTTVNGTQTPSVNATGEDDCKHIPCLFTTAELAVIAICSFSVILLGIIANIYTGIVLIVSKNPRNICSVSIISLTLADLLLSIFVAPFLIISVFFVNGWVFGAVMCKLYVFIQRVAVSAILLNLLVVSLERFLAVCFPFFLRMRHNLFLYAIILVWIVSVAMSTPDLFYMRLFMLKYGGEGCFSEQSVQSALFQSFHEMFFFATMAIMLPIQIITICCLHIKGAALKENSNANYIRLRNACYMMFFLMISCIVCWFPVKISTMILGKNNAQEKLDVKSINIVLVVTVVLYFSCAVIHPIIFFFLSPKGKRTMGTILRNAKKKILRKRSHGSYRINDTARTLKETSL